jgi:transposase
MDYIQGTQRSQLVIFNNYLDEIVSQESHVRFIDAYIDALDLEELGVDMPEMKTGTPPYHPALLLKIYIYCYLERIRSSRKIEKECRRNQELIWLTCQLSPDFKTIADFRKNNGNALKNIFRTFLQFCNKQGLLALKVVATDGSKLRAQNSRNEVYNRETIDYVQQRIEEKIEEYLAILDENDKKEEQDVELNEQEIKKMTERITKLKKRSAKVSLIKELFESDEKLEKYFATDPDSRFQSDKGQKAPGYNSQICVDDENKLIVANQISNESNDYKQMTPMVEEIKSIKEELNIDGPTKNIMDAGYDSEQEIVRNKDTEGVEILVQNKKEAEKNNKKSKAKKASSKKIYGIEAFTYDQENDVYICPEGRKLEFAYNKPEDSGRQTKTYESKDCEGCLQRNACTKNKRGRSISVSINKAIMDQFYDSMGSGSNKKVLAKRKEIVEHPFGTIKRNWGFGYFMQKGMKKVEAEFSFMCFIYNFRRVLNIIPLKVLLQTLKKVQVAG